MPGELMLINPKRRRRVRRMSALQRRYFSKKGSPMARHRKRRHHRRRSVLRLKRNPALRMNVNSVLHGIVPAATGAAGAIAVDYALNAFGPSILPASFMSGPLAVITKIVASVGMGIIAAQVAGRAVGQQVTAGALVVTAYQALNTYVTPQLGLSRYVGAGRLGRYVGAPGAGGLGYINPARIVGGSVNAPGGFRGTNVRAVMPR